MPRSSVSNSTPSSPTMPGSRPTRALQAALAVLLVLTAACSGDGGAEEGDQIALRVVIPDGNIRPEGSDCAGARPYRHVRPGVSYSLQSGEGDVLADGELPSGVAENADPSIDWEDLARIPTVCIMELAFTGIPEHDEYALHIDGVSPMPFTSADVALGTPIVLILPN